MSSRKHRARSMTGFARTTGRVNDKLGYTLGLKSVNHRFLDLHLRLPANCDSLEMQLRKLLKEKLVRGHVEVTLQLDRASKAELQYDHAVVAAYVQAYREAAMEHGLNGDPDLNAAFRLPGALTAEASTTDEDLQALEADVLAQMDGLIEQLNTMRTQEGTALVAELRAGMQRLDGYAAEVAGLREGIRSSYFERMQQRIAELTQGSVDSERILQEAAVLAERSDVEEEIVRLRTHVDHFIGLLEQGGELGKKLDFLLQELNREANTLLSKTGGAASGNGLRITEIGLGMKSEIEKAREQVQNLE
ncbi:MAG: YicC/YloC family endoribonuclease [Acidobacteriaceae bacterium]